MTSKIRPNQRGQALFLKDLRPGETLYQGGWGSGKTWVGARKFLLLHNINRPAHGLVVAPTFGDLTAFSLPELLRTLDSWHWPYEDRSRDALDPKILIQGLGDIIIRSGDAPRRITGFEVGHAWLDEAARLKADMNNPLNNTLVQTRGRLRAGPAKSLHMLLTTTPEGPDTQVNLEFIEKPLKGTRAYFGDTRENPALPAKYVDDLLDRVSPELAEQYIAGKAVNIVTAQAHPTFGLHNISNLEFTGSPIIGMDFNVSPLCWVLVITDGEKYHVADEIYLEDFATVELACHQVKEKGWGKYGCLKLMPDASAHNRSTVGDSQFNTAKKVFRELGLNVQGICPAKNPSVSSRIDRVSTLLRSANGTVRLTISDNCVRLIDDLRNTSRGSNGYDPGPAKKRGHILDALGYAVYREFKRPVSINLELG